MNDNAQKAVAMFNEGFNCAQSVLACCGGPLGLSRKTALQLAGPLGGGLGCMGETCGAVTGAFMVIGLKHAKLDATGDAEKQKGYQLARQFADEFKKRHGSIRCRDLIGFDISAPEGMQKAKESGLFTTLCPKLVADAAEIVEELLCSEYKL